VTKNYREAYGMYAVNGILFNHESPRRGETFVTRKITRAVAAIKAGSQQELYLGNLDPVRDWGYAAEYVEGMWRTLQADQPDDYVLATGVGYTVREFLETSFSHVGLDWRDHVRFDERYLRPTEGDGLFGDATKAKVQLGWTPTIDGLQLARLMVDADVEALSHAGTPWVDEVDLPTWNTRPAQALSAEA
jgi:GDPmannose 4,6-dehydratase